MTATTAASTMDDQEYGEALVAELNQLTQDLLVARQAREQSQRAIVELQEERMSLTSQLEQRQRRHKIMVEMELLKKQVAAMKELKTKMAEDLMISAAELQRRQVEAGLTPTKIDLGIVNDNQNESDDIHAPAGELHLPSPLSRHSPRSVHLDPEGTSPASAPGTSGGTRRRSTKTPMRSRSSASGAVGEATPRSASPSSRRRRRVSSRKVTEALSASFRSLESGDSTHDDGQPKRIAVRRRRSTVARKDDAPRTPRRGRRASAADLNASNSSLDLAGENEVNSQARTPRRGRRKSAKEDHNASLSSLDVSIEDDAPRRSGRRSSSADDHASGSSLDLSEIEDRGVRRCRTVSLGNPDNDGDLGQSLSSIDFTGGEIRRAASSERLNMSMSSFGRKSPKVDRSPRQIERSRSQSPLPSAPDLMDVHDADDDDDDDDNALPSRGRQGTSHPPSRFLSVDDFSDDDDDDDEEDEFGHDD